MGLGQGWGTGGPGGHMRPTSSLKLALRLIFKNLSKASSTAQNQFQIVMMQFTDRCALYENKMWLRWAFDIHYHVKGKMKQVMHDCKYFSLALDESIDVMDVSQLLIFTRTIYSSFEVR